MSQQRDTQLSCQFLSSLSTQLPMIPEDCSTFAIHDLAALAEGNLSPEGLQRLVEHLPRCRTCMEMLAQIVAEMQPSHSTRDHTATALLVRARAARADIKSRG